jgi:predicted AAA+ superfamily ATPase
VLFSRELKAPLLVDEIQYAPQLLSAIKILADTQPGVPCVWITGSQSFDIMRGVRESLAGRVAILNLYGLSLQEKGVHLNASPSELFREFFIGTFPALRTAESDIWARFMSSYTETYIQRDVAELLGIQKRREFEIFLKLCALRTGQLINFEELARDSGISPRTAKEWISILEDSFLIRTGSPYSSNRSKRLIKTPKLYFLDSGLCAYLAGWRDSEQLRLGPWSEAFVETVVFGEVIRTLAHHGKTAQIHFWRDKDGNEVDLIVETGGKAFPIEIKLGAPHPSRIMRHEMIRIDHLQEGRIVSLASSHASGFIKEGWRMGSLDCRWLAH